MQIPQFYGEPLAIYSRVTEPDAPIPLFHYTNKLVPILGDLNTINNLVERGYEPVSGDSNAKRGVYTAALFSQLFDIVYVQDGDQLTPWAHAKSIEYVKQYPVCLAFTLSSPDPVSEERLKHTHIQMLQILPLPRHGEFAMVGRGEDFGVYCFSDLGELGTTRKITMGEAIKDLSGGTEWSTFNEVHSFCASELRYLAIKQDIQANILASRGKVRAEAKKSLENLEQAHNHVVALRQSWLRPDWLFQWSEIRHMAQELAKDYYEHHQNVRKQKKAVAKPVDQPPAPPKPQSMPPLTSSHQTKLPSNNGYRGIEQAFGPSLIRHALWEDENQEHQIQTPNGSLLHIRGQEDFERKALTQYINEMIGTEGLKHTLILLDTFFTQTGGKERLVDAHISLRQLLIRMGYTESKADELEERRKLAHTILYLARTWVTAQETKFEKEDGPRGGKRPGGRRKRGIEYTPLLVIEKMKSSPDGGLDVPDEVKFHLGEDFYNSMFGPGGNFFTLPTLQVLSYHSDKEQQELCLAFYLTNMFYIAQKFSIHFRSLATQSGLLSEDEIDHSPNRMRSALRIIYAIEKLDRDGVIVRNPHEALDTVLAVEYITRKNKLTGSPDEIKKALNELEIQFSDSTMKRIKKQYVYLQDLSEPELNEKRRKSLQHLLKVKEGDPILFSPGPVTQEGVKHREAQRQSAIGKNEHLQTARMIKQVTQQVVANLPKVVDADDL